MTETTKITLLEAAKRRQYISMMQEPLQNEADIAERLQMWLWHFDRAQNIEIKSGVMLGLNDMHVIGMSFCVQLHKMQPDVYTAFDIESVYREIPRLRVHSFPLQEMQWNFLQDVVTALQLELREILPQDPKQQQTSVDLGALIVSIMCRAGYFFANKWPRPPDMDNIEFAALYDDAMHMEQNAAVQFFDCMHSVGSVVRMLVKSTPLQNLEDMDKSCNKTDRVHQFYVEICTNISEHHREVTLDNFYEQSMIGDLYPGSITQYKHRHQSVFHSISQVVFFNWPAYARKRQEPFETLMKNRCYINVVPLLHEMYPDIPVLYEHTGALFAETHSAYSFAWVCIGGFWGLLNKEGAVFYHKDPILTLAHLLANSVDH